MEHDRVYVPRLVMGTSLGRRGISKFEAGNRYLVRFIVTVVVLNNVTGQWTCLAAFPSPRRNPAEIRR